MQPIEIALFGAVIALAAGLIGYLLWPFARARAAARDGQGARTRHVAQVARRRAGDTHAAGNAPSILVCPACQREYDAGLQFCPHDARELVPATDPAARAAAPGMTCPSCRRSFDAMKRFCPFDGDELTALALTVGARAGAGAAGAAGVATFGGAGALGAIGAMGIGAMGKICPHCSRRYESDATFCGRDGAALVSVN